MPIPSFRFVVSVDGEPQAAFTETVLPSVEWDVESVKEGGLNTYVHQLPGQRKAAKLSLKNGVGRSTLVDWYMACMQGPPTRKTLTITLLDEEKEPVMIWHVSDAFPTSWKGPRLESDSNSVAIETLDMACGEVTVTYE